MRLANVQPYSPTTPNWVYSRPLMARQLLECGADRWGVRQGHSLFPQGASSSAKLTLCAKLKAATRYS